MLHRSDDILRPRALPEARDRPVLAGEVRIADLDLSLESLHPAVVRNQLSLAGSPVDHASRVLC